MFRTFFLLLSLSFGGQLLAHDSCLVSIEEFLGELEHVRDSDLDTPEVEFRPTISRKNDVVFSDGQQGMTLARDPDRPWFSTYTSSPIPDSQGNPRAVLFLIGDNGDQLGFQMRSDVELVVPGTAMAVSGVAKMNEQLQRMNLEAVPLGFYPQKIPRAEKYVRNFGEELALPLADPDFVRKDGTSNLNHYIHDLSYHFPSIGFPARDLKMMAEKARFATHLADTIFADASVQAALGSNLDEAKKTYIVSQAADIDILTAQMGTIMLKPDLTTMNRSTQYVHNKIYGADSGADNFVKQHFTRAFAKFPSPQKEQLLAALNQALASGATSYRPKHTQPFPPASAPPYEQFCQDISARRDQIRSALSALAADPTRRIQLPAPRP